MSVQQNKALVLRTIKALEDADFETMLANITDDIDFYVIGSTPFSGHHNGKQALLENVLKPMVDQRDDSGYSEELVSIIGEAETVVMESRGNKTTLSGQSYNNEYAYVFQIRDGLISQWRCYLDTMLLHNTHKSDG